MMRAVPRRAATRKREAAGWRRSGGCVDARSVQFRATTACRLVNLPQASRSLARDRFRLGEKAMAGKMDENVLERRLTQRDRFNLVRKGIHDLADDFMSARPFDPERAVDYLSFELQALKHFALQLLGCGGVNDQYIAADASL